VVIAVAILGIILLSWLSPEIAFLCTGGIVLGIVLSEIFSALEIGPGSLDWLSQPYD
jgi:hypothetical protein